MRGELWRQDDHHHGNEFLMRAFEDRAAAEAARGEYAARGHHQHYWLKAPARRPGPSSEQPVTPTEVATILGDLGAPWWVAGGWAIDLFIGTQTRGHSDLDVAILRADQHLLYAHLESWDLRFVTGQHTPERWDGRTLEPPVHEVWARRAAEQDAGWALEVLLNEHDGDQWVYRRDPAVRLSLAQLGHQRGDVPFLCPEVVLLYKSKRPTANDEADLRVAEPHLSQAQRLWLQRALQMCAPHHPWLAMLR